MNQQDFMILFTAAAPVVELRGAIPLGLALGMPVERVFWLALIGNLVPVPLLLVGLNYLLTRLKKLPRIHAFLMEKAYHRSDKLQKNIDRYGWLALFIFVAIPLPGTGAWSGTLAATILRMRFWPSFLSIVAGVAVAGLLVSGLGAGIMTFF